MIKSQRLQAEFEAMIVALARTYQADRKEVRAAAKLVPERPKKRSGPKEKEQDEAIVDAIIREHLATGRKVHALAKEAAQKMGRDEHATKTIKSRLYTKANEELRWRNWLKKEKPLILVGHKPFERADQARAEAAEAVADEVDRRVNGRITIRRRRIEKFG
jgi:hypothetical protein